MHFVSYYEHIPRNNCLTFPLNPQILYIYANNITTFLTENRHK